MESQIKKGMWPCEGRLSSIHNENADALGLFCAIFPGEAVLSALSDKQSVRSMKIAVGNRAERIQTPVFPLPTNSLHPKMAVQDPETQTVPHITSIKADNLLCVVKRFLQHKPFQCLINKLTLSTLCHFWHTPNLQGDKSEPIKKIRTEEIRLLKKIHYNHINGYIILFREAKHTLFWKEHFAPCLFNSRDIQSLQKIKKGKNMHLLVIPFLLLYWSW